MAARRGSDRLTSIRRRAKIRRVARYAARTAASGSGDEIRAAKRCIAGLDGSGTVGLRALSVFGVGLVQPRANRFPAVPGLQIPARADQVQLAEARAA